MDKTITTESRNAEREAEDAVGDRGVRHCKVCGVPEWRWEIGVTYTNLGPYSGICFDCLSETS